MKKIIYIHFKYFRIKYNWHMIKLQKKRHEPQIKSKIENQQKADCKIKEILMES